MDYLRLPFRALCLDEDEVEARSVLAFSLVIGHHVMVAGDLTWAEQIIPRAFGDHSQGWYAAYARAAATELAVIADLPNAEQHLAAAAPATQQNAWASACLARTAGRLRNDLGALANAVTGWEKIGARFERSCTLLLLPGRAREGRAELKRLGVQTGADPPSRQGLGQRMAR